MTTKELRVIAIDWLQKQGTGVVLCVCFIAYLDYRVSNFASVVVPNHIQALNEGVNTRQLEMIKAFEKEQDHDRMILIRVMEASGTIAPATAAELRETHSDNEGS